jgi:hypothetical protein
MKLIIDLVPASTWGQSCAKVMKRADWNDMRRAVFERQKHRCGICGKKTELKCHELWEYDEKGSIQRLVGFQGVCGLCHFATHFGFAERLAAMGGLDLDAVIAHACSVNRCTRNKWAQHRTDAFAIWRRRNEHKWTINWADWIDPWEFKERRKGPPGNSKGSKIKDVMLVVGGAGEGYTRKP